MTSVQDCSASLRALANPVRIEVIQALLKDGPMHVGQLNQRVQVEASLLSHHLRILREAGLVMSDRDGKAVLYRLAPGVRVRGGRAVDLDCCTLSFPRS